MTDTATTATSAQPQALVQAQESAEPQAENLGNETSLDQSEQKETKEKEQAAQARRMKKIKIKVDGEESEEEIDLDDEEQLRYHLQMSKASKKRMGEALEAKKRAADIVKAFEQDPANVLKRLGPKGREIAEQYLLEQIQDQMLSDEEKELRDLRKFKEEKVKSDQENEEKKKKDAEAEQTKRYREHYEGVFVDALKQTKLPKTDRIVRDMAELQYKSLELGIELTPVELAKELEARELAKIKALINEVDGDSLLALLGDDVATKIRKSDIAKLKAKQSDLFQQPQTPKASLVPKDTNKGYMTPDEWRETINARLKNGG